MMCSGAHPAAPALLAPDDLQIAAPPLSGKIVAPPGERIRKHIDQFACPDRRPRHAFAGEGFDVSTGITHGQDAITAQVLAPAGQCPGTAKPRAIQSVGDRSSTGAKNFADQILWPPRATTRNWIQRCGQMLARAINPDHSNVAVIPHAHINAAGKNRF